MEYPDDFENFWVQYGEKGTNKGPKREAYKSWQKVKKQWMKEENETSPIEFARHVKRGMLATQANRKAARQANQFVANWPMATTWLNQWRFEEEQTTPTSEFRAQAIERTCQCGSQDVIGRSESGGWTCKKCDLEAWKESNTLKPLVDQYPKLKSESWRDWSLRVMAQFPAGRALKRRYDVD